MLIDPSVGVKLIYVLGIANIIGVLLVFFSCRCLVGVRFVNKMFQHDWYKKFYDLHCYYWWFFFASVVLHTITAFLVFGILL